MGLERRSRADQGQPGANPAGEEPGARPEPKVKSSVIDKRLLVEAWEKVRANNGAPGVDAVGIGLFAERLRDNLYKLWNRMSSGSYFPGPVRGVEIPKRPWGKACVCSACRRTRHSAVASSDPSGFVIVTHPFHPLNGQRLEVLYSKRRGADTVFVCAGGVSGQITLPQAWTDRGEPPLARRLSAEGLAGLDTVARSLRGR